MTTDTTPATDAIVTEEMVTLALEAEEDFITDRSRMRAALRAVAPMIAERADQPLVQIERQAIRKAEREACAKIAETFLIGREDRRPFREAIAAAIRARGETQ